MKNGKVRTYLAKNAPRMYGGRNFKSITMPGEVISGGDERDARIAFGIAKFIEDQKRWHENFAELEAKYYQRHFAQRCTCPNIEANGGICNGGCAS